MLNAERSTLFLNDDKTGELWSEVGQGLESLQIRLPNHLGIAGAVFQSGKTINIPYAYADLRFNPGFDKKTNYFTRSILCVPVVNKQGTTIGVRNTRVVDVAAELSSYGVHVDVHEPWVNAADVHKEYGLALVTTPESEAYDGIILAVAHDSYREGGAAALRGYGRPGHVFFDLKSVFKRDESDLRL